MTFDYKMLGPVLALGLPCLGSAIGCAMSGMASHAAMSRVEEGHGQMIGLAASSATQSIYGFILMLLMKNSIDAGTITPMAGLLIAIIIGSIIMVSAILQGRCAATGIEAIARQPAVAGKTFAAVGVVESVALFAFVFALLLIR